MNNNSCQFTRVVPSEDPNICTNLTSVASFKQGCFDCSALDLKRRLEINNWIEENADIIDSIECFLLKHPLFEFPIPLYPMFQFVHHAQLGFIFKDKNGNQIRHLCLQLQNAWWPPVSTTVPINIAQPCKIINPDGSSTIHMNLTDKTAIFANFLEKDNYMAEAVVEMNKYTYFRDINMQYLQSTVNFNFFLESYRVWRMQNTAISQQEYQTILEKNDPSKGLLEQMAFNENFGQNNTTTSIVAPLTNKRRLNGNGDGKMFVLSTFSPAYWSLNEGAVLHFATIKDENKGAAADRFKSFIDWNFINLQCYDNPRQHNKSYSRNYICLSTSALSLDWAKKNVQSSDNFNALTSALRPLGNKKPDWATTNEPWNAQGQAELDFEKIMMAIKKCRNIGQLAPINDNDGGTCQYDYTSCPLVVTGANFNCEIYAAMVISMILNTNTFTTAGVSCDRKFNFNFPGTSFTPDNNNDIPPSNEPFSSYKGPTNTNAEKIGPDADYNLSENLMRMYSAYWPVAMYEPGYETGIFESEFNSSTDPNIVKDRAEFAKQSMIFQYLFNGFNIEAAKTTGNPALQLLSELFSLPLLQTIIGGLGKSASTMAPILNNLMYVLFLYEFLKVETVYIAGYKTNNINNNGSFTTYNYYDCEPAIYKWKIGTSTKRGTANSKLLATLIEWVTAGRTDLLSNFKLFSDANAGLSNTDLKKLNNIKQKFTNVEQDLKELEPSNWPKRTDCDKEYPYDENCGINPMCELKKLENKICNIKNDASTFGYGVGKINNIVGNSVDGIIDIINGGKASEAFLKELSNFVTKEATIFANVIGGNMTRFSTWCHQNYEMNPNIMLGRYPNGNSENNINGIGNLRRPPTGICSKLSSCALVNQSMPDQQQFPVEYITYGLPNSKYNLTNPYKKNDGLFILLVVLSIIIFLVMWFFLIRKITKK
jgi:hypothetical protein